LPCLLLVDAVSAAAGDKTNGLRSAHPKPATAKKNEAEADMFANLLQPHSVQTFPLRPTSALMFEVSDDLDYSAINHNEHRRKLLQSLIVRGDAHGIYGTLRRLSAADLTDASDPAAAAVDDDVVMRRLIDRHNQLLGRFNAERHLSRFERHERERKEMQRRPQRQLEEATEGVDVDDAATAITEAAVEMLYEGVLPVVTEPATVAEAASLCSANDQCVAQGLTGQCCPTDSGTYLACCSGNAEDASSMVAPPQPDIIPPPPGSDVEAPVVSPHEPEPPIVDTAPADPALAEASAIIEDLFDGENPDMVDIIEEENEEEEAFKEMAEAAGIIPVEEEDTLTGGRLDSYQTTPLGQGYGTHCKFVGSKIAT